MSRRTERIGSLIRQLVAETIHHRLNDPRIEPLTSITRVEVSPDLSTARIHVSVLAGEARRRLCLAALQHASGRVRSLIAPDLSLRQIPRLEFALDDSLQRGFETVQVLDQVMKELNERTGATPAGADGSAPTAAGPLHSDDDEPAQEDA